MSDSMNSVKPEYKELPLVETPTVAHDWPGHLDGVELEVEEVNTAAGESEVAEAEVIAAATEEIAAETTTHAE